eukprot:sb/3476610/
MMQTKVSIHDVNQGGAFIMNSPQKDAELIHDQTDEKPEPSSFGVADIRLASEILKAPAPTKEEMMQQRAEYEKKKKRSHEKQESELDSNSLSCFQLEREYYKGVKEGKTYPVESG